MNMSKLITATETTQIQQEKKEVVVYDLVQQYIDTSSKPFVKEFILLTSLYLFYTNVEGYVFTIFVKYALIMLCIRYILNLLTERRKGDKSKYFILNSHLILFTLMCLLYNTYALGSERLILTWTIITSYSLFIISTGEHYTSDILLTLLTVYTLVNNTTV